MSNITVLLLYLATLSLLQGSQTNRFSVPETRLFLHEGKGLKVSTFHKHKAQSHFYPLPNSLTPPPFPLALQNKGEG